MRNPLATHPKPTHTDAHASTGRKGGREEEREREYQVHEIVVLLK